MAPNRGNECRRSTKCAGAHPCASRTPTAASSSPDTARPGTMRARVAESAGHPEAHGGDAFTSSSSSLFLRAHTADVVDTRLWALAALARATHHAVRSAPMLALTTSSASPPARLKTRVGGSTSPRAFSRRRLSRQARALHRETTTRARRFAVGSRKYLSPEPLLQDPSWVAGELQSGYQVPAYSYARNNPVRYVDPTGLSPPDEADQADGYPRGPDSFCALNPSGCPPLTPQPSDQEPDDEPVCQGGTSRKKACFAACRGGRRAIEAFCRTVRGPRRRALCLAGAYAGEAACIGMCLAIYK